MLFSSMTFLWIFLPIVLLGGWVLPKGWRNGFLVLASLFFYAWGEPIYVLLMGFSILLNYGCGLLLEKQPTRKKVTLGLCVAVNLLLLCWFKYAGFLVSALVNPLLGLAQIAPLTVPEISLPIGISFYTFQALSYVIDAYRGEVPVQKKLMNVALYISFFPQLIAGPIVRYKDVNAQIENRTVTPEKLQEGIRRFCYGLGKKVLISNAVAKAADTLFALELHELTGAMVWAAVGLYTLQIYYDFSGYSDMAIGLGKMFGFDFCENFRLPYMSRSIQEFWQRWHISLGTWFREYVYIPLGGNRKGKGRMFLNLGIVFLLTGVWHGASFSFVLWGLYHGFFQIVERLGFNKLLKKTKILSWVYTMLVVMFGWVLFRDAGLPETVALVKRMILPSRYTVTPYPLGTIVTPWIALMAAFGVAGMGFVQAIAAKCPVANKWRHSLLETLYLGAVLLLCIMALAGDTYNPFIYFRF